ncbi:hypothetical protein K2Q00_00850 [Patescibacteria group bacterium]|nr:hypothetical protein [Patescibacteria group bacterium]
MDENTRKWYGIAAAIIVIFIAIAWYLSANHKAVAPTNNTNTTSTSTNATTTGQGSATPGGVQIGVGDTSNLKQPDLNRPYKPLSTLPQSVQDNNKKLYTTAIEQLKFNPNGIAYWLQLGNLRKGADDFAGAEEVWLYVSTRWPTDPIAYNNLADLYGNYLHDYAKATTYWNALIKLSPDNIHAYINLATMQSINLKDKAAARVTLQAGLKANPGNTDLQYALDHLQ